MKGERTRKCLLSKPGRFLLSAVLLVLMPLVTTGGCVHGPGARKADGSAGQGKKVSDERAAQLGSLEQEARAAAPEELGAARFVLEEISYHEKQGDMGEVSRLDKKMVSTLAEIRDRASGSGGKVPSGSEGALRAEIKNLNATIKKLEGRIRNLELSAKIERESLVRRLEAAKAARDEADAEVVAMRAKIQGMASPSEASAMFAEARVLIDQMVEGAYRVQALEEVELAEHYLLTGKKALDEGNPAGAAYMFDKVTELYRTMQSTNPDLVTVKVRSAALRSSPSQSAPSLGYLSQGDSARGQEKQGRWMQVRTSSGLVGWILQDQVQ